jgi:hypothetical protein
MLSINVEGRKQVAIFGNRVLRKIFAPGTE